MGGDSVDWVWDPHFSRLSEKKGLVAVVGGRVGIWSFGSFLLFIIFLFLFFIILILKVAVRTG